MQRRAKIRPLGWGVEFKVEEIASARRVSVVTTIVSVQNSTTSLTAPSAECERSAERGACVHSWATDRRAASSDTLESSAASKAPRGNREGARRESVSGGNRLDPGNPGDAAIPTRPWRTSRRSRRRAAQASAPAARRLIG